MYLESLLLTRTKFVLKFLWEFGIYPLNVTNSDRATALSGLTDQAIDRINWQPFLE